MDIEGRLEEASRKVSSSFSLAEAVQRYLPPRPWVARRHSYQTGTLRYFNVEYVDASTLNQVALNPSSGASGSILVCLPVNYADVATFVQWAQKPPLSQRRDIIIGIAERTIRLAELLQELRCLHWVEAHTPELSGDLAARRELRARLAAVEALVHNELERAVSLHRLGDASNARWFNAGKPIQLQPRQGLTHFISNICDDLYSQTPFLRNELVNRRALSSQGAAARRNLLEGMLQRAEKDSLGIEGYPPERSMYESLLKASGLHRQAGQGHWFLADPPGADPLRIRPVWEAIADFIFKPPVEPRLVSDLFACLSQPPYGLTEGVMPVFLCAFLLVHQNETTFYREGSLQPELEIADWEVLLRRPELFAVAGCRIEGPRQAILERFGRGLGVEPAAMPVVRALIRNLKTLPEHAWRTQRYVFSRVSYLDDGATGAAPRLEQVQAAFCQHPLASIIIQFALFAQIQANSGPGEMLCLALERNSTGMVYNLRLDLPNGAVRHLSESLPRLIAAGQRLQLPPGSLSH